MESRLQHLKDQLTSRPLSGPQLRRVTLELRTLLTEVPLANDTDSEQQLFSIHSSHGQTGVRPASSHQQQPGVGLEHPNERCPTPSASPPTYEELYFQNPVFAFHI